MLFHLSKEPRSDEVFDLYMTLNTGNSESQLELLDLSNCKGLDMESFANNAPVFGRLTSLLLPRCGLSKKDTQHLVKLFEKMPGLVFLDVRHNKLEVGTVIQNLKLLPNLSYLLLDGNGGSELHVQELRKQGVQIKIA